MKKSFLVIIIIAVVVLAGGIILWVSSSTTVGTVAASPVSQNSGTDIPPVDTSSPVSSTAPATPAPPASEAVITYSDSGFSPATLTVTQGTTVTFKNGSSRNFWPAANPHPIHTSYPTTGGCIGSTFDACAGIAPGGSWSFTFNAKGIWGYHDHLSPGKGGKVIVQ